MYHDLGDNIIKVWLSSWIRELSTNNGVNLSWCDWPGSSIKENEEVHMGEATLLELNGIDMGHCPSKDSLLGDFIQKRFHFKMEDMCNNTVKTLIVATKPLCDMMAKPARNRTEGGCDA